jgi:hypothetical protein
MSDCKYEKRGGMKMRDATRCLMIAALIAAVWATQAISQQPVRRRFPQKLDDSAPGKATPQNPLFGNVVNMPVQSSWTKVTDTIYTGPTGRQYHYDATTGRFTVAGGISDQSGYNRNAVIRGGVWVSDSPYASSPGSYKFYGNSGRDRNFVEVQGQTIPPGPVTIEVTTRSDSSRDDGWNCVYWNYENQIALGGNRVMVRLYNGADYWLRVDNVNTRQWMHIAVTFDGDRTGKLYINGQLRNTVTTNGRPLTTCGMTRFGADENTYAGGIPGSQANAQVKDIRISNNVRYAGNFTPPTEPMNKDASTTGLWVF